MMDAQQYVPSGSMRLPVAVWLISSFLMLLGVTLHEVRYAMYIPSGIALLAVIQRRRIFWNETFAPMALYVVGGVLTIPLTGVLAGKDAFFVLAGLTPLLVARCPNFTDRGLWLLLLSFSISGVLSAVLNHETEPLSVDVVNSTSTMEGPAAFLCGLVGVAAISRKRWLLFFVATAFTALFLKRAALLGLAVCILLPLISHSWRNRLLRPGPMIFANLVGVVLALQYAIGGMDYYLFEIFGRSGNELGLGRQALQEFAAREIISNWSFLFFGHGIGSAYQTFMGFFGGGEANLHSDVIKIIYEFGIVFFMLILFFAYRIKSLGARMLFLYTNLLWFTDNVVIYSFYLFFLLSLQLAAERYEETNAV